MSYGLNLSVVSLQDFKEILRLSYLIPSMRMLLNDIDKRFEILNDYGIINLEELYFNTKTKKKAEMLSEKIGIDSDYIIVLRRMVSSYIPKPRKLREYPDIDEKLIEFLLEMNIKTSVELFDFLIATDQAVIVKKLDLKQEKLVRIKSLMNVS